MLNSERSKDSGPPALLTCFLGRKNLGGLEHDQAFTLLALCQAFNSHYWQLLALLRAYSTDNARRNYSNLCGYQWTYKVYTPGLHYLLQLSFRVHEFDRYSHAVSFTFLHLDCKPTDITSSWHHLNLQWETSVGTRRSYMLACFQYKFYCSIDHLKWRRRSRT